MGAIHANPPAEVSPGLVRSPLTFSSRSVGRVPFMNSARLFYSSAYSFIRFGFDISLPSAESASRSSTDFYFATFDARCSGRVLARPSDSPKENRESFRAE